MVHTYIIWRKQKGCYGDQVPSVQIFLGGKADKWMAKPAKLSTYPNPVWDKEPWDLAKWSAHGNILLTALFAVPNNEALLILWQVIFISSKYIKIKLDIPYLARAGIVWDTECVYPFKYESKIKWWNMRNVFCIHQFVKISMGNKNMKMQMWVSNTGVN